MAENWRGDEKKHRHEEKTVKKIKDKKVSKGKTRENKQNKGKQ